MAANLTPGTPVCWLNGERHCIGKVASVRKGGKFTALMRMVALSCVEGEQPHEHHDCLIPHYHTGELEFVAERGLKPYPESPIPTP